MTRTKLTTLEYTTQLKERRIRPLGDRVLVRMHKDRGRSSGGIIMPEIAKSRPSEGTVLAVGPGRRDPDTGKYTPIAVKVGDVIKFPVVSTFELSEDSDNELAIIHESDIWGVFE